MLVSLLGFVSRKVTLTTTLTAQLNPEDATATLDDDPGVGTRLTVDPGSAALEETFKVTSSTPSGGNFICGIVPTAEQLHLATATVNYEPGDTARLLDDETPTPVSTVAPFYVEEGCSGNGYRVSVLGTCDNGEIVEDEVDIDVVEFTPTTEVTKQPAEIKDIAVSFAGWTDLYSTTLSSVQVFLSRTLTKGSTVNGSNTAGATTLNINAVTDIGSPGVGALLIVNAGQANAEKLLVSAVGGSGPYACTVSPLQFAHANAEVVSVQPGVNARVLVSAAVVMAEAIIRLRQATAGQTYLMAVIGTLADGQVVQKSITLIVTEE